MNNIDLISIRFSNVRLKEWTIIHKAQSKQNLQMITMGEKRNPIFPLSSLYPPL